MAGPSLRSSLHPSTSSAGELDQYVGEMKGYRLVSCDRLSGAVSEIAVCSLCTSPLTVEENLVVRRGLVSKLTICCTARKKEAVVSDPYTSDAKSLNGRSVLGVREIGRGRNSLGSFCGIMDMLPPLSIPAYTDHNCCLAKISIKCARENMVAASAHLHQSRGVPFDEIIDVPVTCDGTWSKRGFTATYGVVAVIAWETGQVLDFEIKSKHCSACSRKLQTLEKTSNRFMEWWETHKSMCEANYEGSSLAMEAAAALDIRKRSEEHLYLRFTEVICDGDSRQFVCCRRVNLMW